MNSTVTTKKRVIIVDDHPMLRERLVQVVNHEEDLEACSEAEDSTQAMEAILRETPDLVIVDITLKDSSGLELIKQIREHSATLPILVLSMHEESLYAERVLRAGGNGYITKHEHPKEVIAAIRRILAGGIYVSETMASVFLKGMLRSRGRSSPRSVERLTDRELAVLEMIGQGRTTRQIATTLKLGTPTIDTYRDRIKEKMNLQNAAELLHFAIRWVQEREQGASSSSKPA
jgi:DNA-binding NarL/FixJ family response regulator